MNTTPDHIAILTALNLQLQRQVSSAEISIHEADRMYQYFCMEKDINKLRTYLK